MPLLVLVAAVLTAGFAPAPPPRPNKVDLKRMQGAWVLTALTEQGRTVSRLPPLRLTIEGDRLTYLFGEKSFAFTLTLDAAKTPKRCAIRSARRGENAPLRWRIYSLEGDSLTFSNDLSGGPPRAHDRPGRGQYAEVFTWLLQRSAM
jgi:uncharacterized protein (TIGR03067 family)